LLLFDAAYEAYIARPDACRIRFTRFRGRGTAPSSYRSFSKHGGFTGVRCAYTVVPKSLLAGDARGSTGRAASALAAAFDHEVQRRELHRPAGAEALYTPEGKAQVRQLIDHYLGNAKVLRGRRPRRWFTVFGGENAPYLWVQAPAGLTSWQAFDKMLNEANVVITPGSGFGKQGEGLHPDLRLQQPHERRRSRAPAPGVDVVRGRPNRKIVAALHEPSLRSAGFSTCRVADFQSADRSFCARAPACQARPSSWAPAG